MQRTLALSRAKLSAGASGWLACLQVGSGSFKVLWPAVPRGTRAVAAAAAAPIRAAPMPAFEQPTSPSQQVIRSLCMFILCRSRMQASA